MFFLKTKWFFQKANKIFLVFAIVEHFREEAISDLPVSHPLVFNTNNVNKVFVSILFSCSAFTLFPWTSSSSLLQAVHSRLTVAQMLQGYCFAKLHLEILIKRGFRTLQNKLSKLNSPHWDTFCQIFNVFIILRQVANCWSFQKH